MINKYRIGIVGSDFGTIENNGINRTKIETLNKLCYQLGKLFDPEKCIIYSGGDGGFPRQVMQGAYENGCETIGIYPQLFYQKDEKNEYISIPIFSGLGYGMRDILLIRSVECIIAIGGGAGTLNEITNAYHNYLPIITLQNSGGWSDKLAHTYIDNKEKIFIQSYSSIQTIASTAIADIEKCREKLKKEKEKKYEL